MFTDKPKILAQKKIIGIPDSSIIIHKDEKQELDFSFSEEIIGSTKTVYTSDRSSDNWIKHDFKSDEQIWMNISAILSELSLTPPKYERRNILNETIHKWKGEKCIRLHNRVDYSIVKTNRLKKSSSYGSNKSPKRITVQILTKSKANFR